MRDVIRLLGAERRARLFYVALTQSTLGTGAAYVALLLIAYDRFQSPWAISLVLLAELVPAMVLGPVFGAAADRWSRKRCMIAADVVRAAAFVGIAVIDSFVATVALAAFAGAGTALFAPAALAALPSLVTKKRLPAATSLYGAISDLGFTGGPALAALLLLFAGAEEIILFNGVTFAISAGILMPLHFGAAATSEAHGPGRLVPSLFREAREGLKVIAGMRSIRVVIAGSTAALFFGGIFNVGELLFATDELGASDAGYSVLVALFGFGFIGGSLAGSRGGSPQLLKRRFMHGVFLSGVGLLLSGMAPTFLIALFTFTLAGFGNGLLLVHERVLIQETVPDALMGRAFGVKDALASWAFGVAFFAAGGLLSVIDSRELILGAGVGGVLVWGGCVLAFRGERPSRVVDGRFLRGRRGPVGDLRGDEQGADMIGGGDLRPALLDHLDEGGHNPGVELGSRVRR